MACGDHAPLARTESKHGVVQGGRGADSDVNHGAAGKAQTKRQRRYERCVVRSPVPSHHDHAPFSRKSGLRVGERFTHEAHECGREGALLLKLHDGCRFAHGFQRRQATDAVGAEKRVHHVNPSSVLAAWPVNTGDGCVGPHDAVTTQHNPRVGDAVATRGCPLPEHSAEFSQAAGDSVSGVAKMDLLSVVSEIAKFGPCAEVHVLSKNRITNVVEVRRFCSGEKDGMLDFRRMTDQGVGANPAVFSNVCSAADHGSGSDVARANQVRPRFNGRGFMDDDA